jgi:hypothetical protein
MAKQKQQPIEKAKRGQPTKYTKDMPERIQRLFKDGKSLCTVCAELGICRNTFYEYVKVYLEFSTAYDRGLELSQSWWEELGRKGAAGKVPIIPAVWIFNMKNRFSWRDRSDITETVTLSEETRQRLKKIYADNAAEVHPEIIDSQTEAPDDD